MSAPPAPLQPRRGERTRTQAPSLAAEMGYRRLQEADQALMRRLGREHLQYDTASDSDTSEGEPEGDPSSDEEVEAKENTPPTTRWSLGTNSINSNVCTAHATLALPRDREHSELGYLRCFMLDTLIEIMVSSTNAYAQSLRASPPFVTDAAEMRRFMAVRIRMGIVRLPETRMYWQAEFRDTYVTQLLTRNRFDLLLRYWHIAPPSSPFALPILCKI